MTKTKQPSAVPNKQINYIATRSKRATRRPEGPVDPVVQMGKRTRDQPHPGWDSDVLLHLLRLQGILDADQLRQRITECKRRHPCGSVLCSTCAARHQQDARTRMIECINAAEGAVKFMTIFGPPMGIGDEPPGEIALKVARWWNNETRGLKRAFARSLPGVRFVAHLDLRVILRQHIQTGDTQCAFVRRALPDWEKYEAVLAPHLHGLVVLPSERHLRKARRVLKERYEIKKQYELKDLKASQIRDEAVNKLAAYSTEFSPIYYDKVGQYFTPESRVLDADHLLIVDAIQQQLPLGRWMTEFSGGGVDVVIGAPTNPLKSSGNMFSGRAQVRIGSSSSKSTGDRTNEVVHCLDELNLLVVRAERAVTFYKGRWQAAAQAVGCPPDRRDDLEHVYSPTLADRFG